MFFAIFPTRIEALRKLREELQRKLEMVLNAKLSAEEKALRMQQLLDHEEYNQKGLMKELKSLQEVHFKKIQEVNDAKQKIKTMNNDIQGLRASNRNMTSKIAELDHDSLKQQEVLYNQVRLYVSLP